MADLYAVAPDSPLTHWRRPRLSQSRKPATPLRSSLTESGPPTTITATSRLSFSTPTRAPPPTPSTLTTPPRVLENVPTTPFTAPSQTTEFRRPRIMSAQLPGTTSKLNLRPLVRGPSLSQLNPPPSRPPPATPTPTLTPDLNKIVPRTLTRQSSGLTPPNKAPPGRPDKNFNTVPRSMGSGASNSVNICNSNSGNNVNRSNSVSGVASHITSDVAQQQTASTLTRKRVPPPPPSAPQSTPSTQTVSFGQLTVASLLNSAPTRAAPSRQASLIETSGATASPYPARSPSTVVTGQVLVASHDDSSRAITSFEELRKAIRIPPPPPPLPSTSGEIDGGSISGSRDGSGIGSGLSSSRNDRNSPEGLRRYVISPGRGRSSSRSPSSKRTSDVMLHSSSPATRGGSPPKLAFSPSLSPSNEFAAMDLTPELPVHRQKAIEACLKSEREYVGLLDVIHKEWYEPLKDLLSASFLLTLFSNFVALRQFHHTFLAALEKDFTPAFIKHSEFVKMYCSYLNSFPEAISLYATGLRDHKKFHEFHSERKARLGQTLLDYLVRPVQRLGIFVPLIKAVLVNSPPDNHSAALESAFGLVDIVARHLEGEAQAAEQLLQVLDVQLWLEPCPTLLRRNRFLVRGYGILQKVGGNILHSVKPRYVFLFNDLLLWATPNRQLRGKMDMVKGSAKALNGAPLGKPGPVLYPFIVVTPEKTVTFMSVDAADREEWIQACNEVFSGEAKGGTLPQFHFRETESPVTRSLTSHTEPSPSQSFDVPASNQRFRANLAAAAEPGAVVHT